MKCWQASAAAAATAAAPGNPNLKDSQDPSISGLAC